MGKFLRASEYSQSRSGRLRGPRGMYECDYGTREESKGLPSPGRTSCPVKFKRWPNLRRFIINVSKSMLGLG